MNNSGIPVRQVRELVEVLKRSVFRDFAPGTITCALPEYLPPVLLSIAAGKSVLVAAGALASCALAGEALLISAHYEDHHDMASCCVVVALQLRRPGIKDVYAVDSAWLEKVGTLSRELLIESVDLSVQAEGGSLTFDIRIPVHHSSATPAVHRNAILLVEDEEFVRHATRDVLQLAGYAVVEASNAEEALLEFERRRHSLCAVLSDVTMPGRDGRELAALLHVSAPALPILLTSGYANPVVEDFAKRIYFLAKPYNSDALLKALQRCLQVHHQPVESASETTFKAGLLGAAERCAPFASTLEV